TLFNVRQESTSDRKAGKANQGSGEGLNPRSFRLIFTQLAPAFCDASSASRTSRLCVPTFTVVQTLQMSPCGSIKNVCRDDSFVITRLTTEPYFFETSPFVSASNRKLSPSFVQKAWCVFSSCVLTPRIAALRLSYSVRSR